MANPHSAARPGWAVVVGSLAWVLCLGALALLLLSEDPFPADAHYYQSREYFTLHVVTGITSGTAATIVLARSIHPAGVVAAVIALCFATSAFSLCWAFVAAERGWPGVGLAVHGFAGASQPGVFVAMAVLPWVIRRDPCADGPRRAVIGIGTCAVLLLTLVAVTQQQDGAPSNPLAGMPGSPAPPVWTILSLFVTCLVVGALGLADLVLGWRRGHQGDGRALAFLVAGTAVLLATIGLVQFLPAHPVWAVLPVPLLFLGQTIVSLSVVVLTLGTWDLDSGRGVPRAATGALLAGLAALLYLLLVTAAEHLLGVDPVPAGLGAVLVLTLVLHPLRHSLQRWVDHLLLGAAAEPTALVASVGRRLSEHTADEVLPHLADNLRSSLRLGTVEIAPYAGAPVRSQAADNTDLPATGSEEHAVPLVIGSRAVGDLRIRPRPGRTVAPATLDALAQSAALVAAAVDLAATNQRLRDASSRLVEVRHEERRMLRRELHDGLGPALAGVALGLAAAQRRIAHDPGGTAGLLEELREEVTGRIDDVRTLARAVLPPALDDGDLAAALDTLATRFRGAGMRVEVRCGAADLATPTQVALYQVTAEALLNAHRHGRARTVVVDVGRSPDGLVLEITDDGVGIDRKSSSTGVGLQSMRERADALSATLTVGPNLPGPGSFVRMRLP